MRQFEIPHDVSSPPELKENFQREPGSISSLDKNDLSVSLQKRIRLRGNTADNIQAAVVIGENSAAIVEVLYELTANLSRVLILEPNPEVLDELEQRLKQVVESQQTERAIFFAEFTSPIQGYSTDAYLEICQFLLTQHLPLQKVLFVSDSYSRGQRREGYQPIIEALMDIQLSRSSRFIELIAGQQTLPTTLINRWAKFLAKHQEPFHALKFFYVLKDHLDTRLLNKPVCQCWEALSCPEPMLEWIASHMQPGPRKEQLSRELADQIQHRQQTARETKEKNLAALHEKYPRIFQQLQRLEDKTINIYRATLKDVPWKMSPDAADAIQLDDFELFFTIDDALIREINPPADPLLFLEVYQDPKGIFPPHVLLGSTIQTDFLFNILKNPLKSKAPNWEQAVYLLEKELKHFAVMIESYDLTPWINEKRAHWFLGTEGKNELLSLFRKNPDRKIPELRIGIEPQLGVELSRIVEGFNASTYDIIARLPELYPPSKLDELRAGLKGESARPLRILFVTSFFTSVVQYVARDMAEAFRQLGHETRVVQESESCEQLSMLSMAEEMTAFKPDLVFLIDHLRPEFKQVIPPNIPVICWVQDELPNLIDPQNINALGKLDFTYFIDLGYLTKHQALGYPHARYLPFAVNTHCYRPSENAAEPENAVAMITNLVEPTWITQVPQLYKALRELFESIDEPQKLNQQKTLIPLLYQQANQLGLHIPQESLHAWLCEVGHLLRYIDRLRVASWLVEAGVPLKLFGRGWERVEHLAPFACGVVEAGEPLRKIYQQTKVVLHTTHVNLHMRIFECLASGGFILARTCPEDTLPGYLCDHLVLGEEIILFNSLQELLQFIGKAFNDEPWRKGVIAKGQKRVLRDHGYINRAKFVLEDIRNKLLWAEDDILGETEGGTGERAKSSACCS